MIMNVIKKLVFLCLFVSCITEASYSKKREIISEPIMATAVAGFIGVVVVGAVFAVTRWVRDTFFSASCYYNSAKKLYKHTTISGIDDARSFDDLIGILENQTEWDSLLLSDCYLVDVYHFLKQRIENLITAKSYLKTAIQKRDCDTELCMAIKHLQRKVKLLQKALIRSRILCEYHPLFSIHLKIYHEKERLELERQRILQESLNAATIANAIREKNTKKKKKADKKAQSNGVLIQVNL
jgi:hypothetical protein